MSFHNVSFEHISLRLKIRSPLMQTVDRLAELAGSTPCVKASFFLFFVRLFF